MESIILTYLILKCVIKSLGWGAVVKPVPPGTWFEPRCWEEKKVKIDTVFDRWTKRWDVDWNLLSENCPPSAFHSPYGLTVSAPWCSVCCSMCVLLFLGFCSSLLQAQNSPPSYLPLTHVSRLLKTQPECRLSPTRPAFIPPFSQSTASFLCSL